MKENFLNILSGDSKPLHHQLGEMANQAVEDHRAADAVLLNAYANRENLRAERENLESNEKRLCELEATAEAAIEALTQNPLCTISGWEDKEGLAIVKFK
jgi:hypothetical protein